MNNKSSKKEVINELLWGYPKAHQEIRYQQLAFQHLGLAQFSPVIIFLGFMISRINDQFWIIFGYSLMYFGVLLTIMGLIGAWWYRNRFFLNLTGYKAIIWKLLQYFLLILDVTVIVVIYIYGIIAFFEGKIRF